MCLVILPLCPDCYGRYLFPSDPVHTAFCNRQIALQTLTRIYRNEIGKGPLKPRHFLPCADFKEVSINYIMHPMRFDMKTGLPLMYPHNCLKKHGEAKAIDERKELTWDVSDVKRKFRQERVKALKDAWKQDIEMDEDYSGDDEEFKKRAAEEEEDEDEDDDEDDKDPPDSKPWTEEEDRQLFLACMEEMPFRGMEYVTKEMAPRTMSECERRMAKLDWLELHYTVWPETRPKDTHADIKKAAKTDTMEEDTVMEHAEDANTTKAEDA
ncbi:hypothetical protein B0T16DRAFT_460457 [Cercophora newfieldiana]|uniref:Uncharacterized protein n=1 Tax=Cercophora newfieldiana TaxID=92897 RepID=A0AA39Y2U8_9PEZI|nr:hypothetical protein B0T16DRAFT_460457 [Cercophora newfieldiana]